MKDTLGIWQTSLNQRRCMVLPRADLGTLSASAAGLERLEGYFGDMTTLDASELEDFAMGAGCQPRMVAQYLKGHILASSISASIEKALDERDGRALIQQALELRLTRLRVFPQPTRPLSGVWVSVLAGVPPLHEEVLVWCSKSDNYEAGISMASRQPDPCKLERCERWIGFEDRFEDDTEDADCFVTHWTTLPHAPVGEE